MRIALLFLGLSLLFAGISKAEYSKIIIDTVAEGEESLIVSLIPSDIPAQNLPFLVIKIPGRTVEVPLFFSTHDVNRPTLIALTILTGLLGGHRLYLGTKPIVPVVYALTLGGGFGILPFVDLLVITFTKDLSKYENNPRIIMWAE